MSDLSRAKTRAGQKKQAVGSLARPNKRLKIMPDDASADPWQIIVDLQRKLDERTAERDEALDQRTATAEVLEVINSSPGDLTPVFDAMLDKALRLCEAAIGMIWSFDGEYFRAVATRGLSPSYAEFLHEPQRAGPDTGIGLIQAGGSVVHVADYATGKPMVSMPAHWPVRLSSLPAHEPASSSRCARKKPCSAPSGSSARKSGRSPTSNSPCCRISPPRQ